MNKYGHNMTWDEWTEDLLAVSGGEIDHTGISEETAERKYPCLYGYYEAGEDPDIYIAENRMVYKDEGDYIEIWTDPDEPDDFDYELDAILSNTEFFKTFSAEILNLKALNGFTTATDATTHTLKKQILVSAITCLETYLSDAFINTVLSNKEYLKLFFKTYKDFKDESFKMNTLFDTFDKAESIATKKMLEVMYHNLPKVQKMYKNTLNISFPKFDKLAKYVSQRHDLVHRNGREQKINGKFLSLDTEYIYSVITDIEDFVNSIDKDLKDKEIIHQHQPKANENDWDNIVF